jgi:hypothetical protein
MHLKSKLKLKILVWRESVKSGDMRHIDIRSLRLL